MSKTLIMQINKHSTGETYGKNKKRKYNKRKNVKTNIL